MLSKEKFWELIDKARVANGGDTDGMHEWLVNWLVKNGDPSDAITFDYLVREYTRLSYKYGLWTAAMVMSNGFRSDDGFHYFQMWLIAQGKEVYLNALANPDSLADVGVVGHSEFESLDYIGNDAYEALTEEDPYDLPVDKAEMTRIHNDAIQDIHYGEDIESWHDEDVLEYLPNLCAAYPQK